MNVEIANKLVNLRKQLGLSQEGLAEKIGVSRQAVSKWERSESSPDTENLIALSRIYGISIDEMLDYKINSETADKVESTGETYSYSDLDDSEMYSEDDDEDGKSYKYKAEGEIKIDKRSMRSFPVSIVVTLIYLFLGIVFSLWHPAWVIFLLIPVFHIFTSKREKGERWKSLPYPVVCTVIFLLLGFLFGGWYYAWLIFLTIPIWGYFIKR